MKKTNLLLAFCKMGLTLKKNKFEIVQKNFAEIKIILIKKRSFEKATGHNDHNMINMGGQRPKIGGN